MLRPRPEQDILEDTLDGTLEPAPLASGVCGAESVAQLECLAAPVADENTDYLSDESLLMAYCELGDRASLEVLVRRYQVELYSYLRRYLGDDGLAEDAFQLTFLQVHKKAALFDSSRRFRPWLYGVATNQAIDLKRREKRRRHRSLDVSPTSADVRESTHAGALPDHRAAVADPLIVKEQSESIQAALDELGEPGRSAVELVYLQGMQYREAALILDVPVGTVKSRVHTAIRKLADIWKRTVKSVD